MGGFFVFRTQLHLRPRGESPDGFEPKPFDISREKRPEENTRTSAKNAETKKKRKKSLYFEAFVTSVIQAHTNKCTASQGWWTFGPTKMTIRHPHQLTITNQHLPESSYDSPKPSRSPFCYKPHPGARASCPHRVVRSETWDCSRCRQKAAQTHLKA